MNEERSVTPPFDGESDNTVLPDTAGPQDETTRGTDLSDTPLPMNSPARGPMDQSVPDVATGSTPVTRRDD